MKISVLIILLSSIFSIEEDDDYYYEYDLVSGSSKYVSSLRPQITYKFYVPALVDQKVDIQFIDSGSSYSYTLSQYLTVYEYSSRSSETELTKKSIVLNYDFGPKKYFKTYTIYYSSCTYLAFEIIPQYHMTSVYITATVNRGIYEYDLTSGSTQSFPTMSTSYIYKFYMVVEYGETADFEYTKSDSTYTSKEYVTIYRYTTRYATIELFKKNFTLSYDSTKKTFSQSYENEDIYCSYLAFEITPDYQMTSVNVKAIIKIVVDYEDDLDRDSQNNVGTLYDSYTYKFYISAKTYEKITIEFTKTDSISDNIQNVNIYEYSNRASTTELSKKSKNLSFSSSKNSFSTSYSVEKPSCNYVAFEMRPRNTMSYVKVINTIKTYSYNEYNLTSGSSIYIPTLSTSGIYKFYLSVQYDQTVYIEFTKSDSIAYNYQYITVFEYSTRSSISELNRESYTLSYNSTKNSYSKSFYIYKPSTTYTAIQIIPYYKMTSVYINATAIYRVYDYDLTSGKSESHHLYNYYIYKFYLPAFYDQMIDIELAISNPSSTSKQNITIYQYSNRNSINALLETTYTVPYNTTKKAYSKLYNVTKVSTSYIAFEIKPSYVMNYVYINATVISKINTYDISSGSSKFFSKLSKSYIYKFYIPSEAHKTINISFNKSDLLSTSEQFITVYEYSSRISTIELKKTKAALNYSSSKKSYTLSYNSSNPSCKYISFEIQPYYEMENVDVVAYVITPIYVYDLMSGYEKYLTILYNKIIYKFYIPIYFNEKVDIEIKIFNSDSSTTYQYINIYEYSSRASLTELVKENCSLFYNHTENLYTKSYKVSSSNTKYLAFEIILFGEMSTFSIRATVEYIPTKIEDEDENENKISFSTILIPVIIGVCIIALIACCYISKSKRKENQISVQNLSVQPLYPVNNYNTNYIPPY